MLLHSYWTVTNFSKLVIFNLVGRYTFLKWWFYNTKYNMNENKIGKMQSDENTILTMVGDTAFGYVWRNNFIS